MRYLKKALPLALLALGLAAFSVFSLRSQSSQRLQRGIELESSGNLPGAIEQYEWAIQAYTPFGGRQSEAIARLESIASSSREKGDKPTARLALQAIVSGLSVIEHVSQPYEESLESASRELKAVELSMLETNVNTSQSQ